MTDLKPISEVEIPLQSFQKRYETANRVLLLKDELKIS